MVNAQSNSYFSTVWKNLIEIYNHRLDKRPWYLQKLTADDLQKWAELMGIQQEDLLEKIAIRLAQGFHKNELDFIFCDAVMNDMFNTDIGRECKPNLFWQIYLAFDAGEACLSGKESGNPPEDYTRPRIAEIIKSLSTD